MTELFNGCEYLLDRRVSSGDGARVALAGTFGEITYHQLQARVNQVAGGLREIGLEAEQRLMIFMSDSPEFVTLFLAALRIGAIPVPVSTMLRADGLTELLVDSRARLLAVSPEFLDTAQIAVKDAPELVGVISDATLPTSFARPIQSLGQLSQLAGDDSIYPTTDDSPAFWLYTSGTTGTPKAAMHRHGAIEVVCRTYAQQVLQIEPDDRCLSAAKAFFAYGLGNSILFPMSVGATAILDAAPAKPDSVVEHASKHGATLFFAGPTFFANMLRSGLPADSLRSVRIATSAGEALPAALYDRWTSHFGIDILDGIGMTEMLHIFLSNRPGNVRPGTTGLAVPGYDLRIATESGGDAEIGVPGTLFVRGESAASGYWSRYAASRQVFQGEWLCTGDTYVQDADGFFTCLGRNGDMLKASGIWVSPTEVEQRLMQHPAVGQAVVVAASDSDGLDKPIAYVILAAGAQVEESELIEFCRTGLPSFKRPRRVVFVDSYPVTSTGKIRRVELRSMAARLSLTV
jgi:benzoate-CoA ligase family protein